MNPFEQGRLCVDTTEADNLPTNRQCYHIFLC